MMEKTKTQPSAPPESLLDMVIPSSLPSPAFPPLPTSQFFRPQPPPFVPPLSMAEAPKTLRSHPPSPERSRPTPSVTQRPPPPAVQLPVVEHRTYESTRIKRAVFPNPKNVRLLDELGIPCNSSNLPPPPASSNSLGLIMPITRAAARRAGAGDNVQPGA